MSRVKTSNLIDSLRDNFGTKIVASDIKGYCAANDISYPTVTRHLEPYKTGRGKWDLTISEARNQFEQQVSITETEVVKQNLIPTKDDTFVKFGLANSPWLIMPPMVLWWAERELRRNHP